jgi:hypothetical protein
MPKHKRERKTPAQIQNSSLDPKPFINCVKQIGQKREGREFKPKRGFDDGNGPSQDG